MKKLFSVVLSLLVCNAARADVAAVPPAANAATSPAAPNTLKSVWAQGLKQPQGMAWLDDMLYVAEYGGGQVSKWSHDGKPLGAITGLKGPAWVEKVSLKRFGPIAKQADGLMSSKISTHESIWISERKANRVVRLFADGTTQPVGEVIEEPLGLAQVQPTSPKWINEDENRVAIPTFPERAIAVAHTTSRVMRWDGTKWQLLYAPEGDGARYGYRNVVVDSDSTVFLSDEEEGEILAITPGGRAFVVARGLKDPAAIVIGPDKALYVAEEGAGRVVRLNRDGSNTPIADGLGAPRDIEFQDAKTMLVSDKTGGTIWKVVLN